MTNSSSDRFRSDAESDSQQIEVVYQGPLHVLSESQMKEFLAAFLVLYGDELDRPSQDTLQPSYRRSPEQI